MTNIDLEEGTLFVFARVLYLFGLRFEESRGLASRAHENAGSCIDPAPPNPNEATP